MPRMSKAQKAQQESERTESANYLRQLLNDGRPVYTLCTHVARSGMSRSIRLIVIDRGEPRDISWSAATVLGWKVAEHRSGVVVRGCGMDMGFHVVDSLSRTLGMDPGWNTQRWL